MRQPKGKLIPFMALAAWLSMPCAMEAAPVKTAAAAIPGSANRLINYLKSSSGTVELRRAKFEGSGTLGYFIPGTGVIVLSRNADEGWAYIQVGSTKGYVDLANLNRNP